MISVLDEEEASRIAEELTAKYGHEALEYVRDRAARAIEVGDHLAYGAWQSVMAAARQLLEGTPSPVL
jgi:hypothetical protein